MKILLIEICLTNHIQKSDLDFRVIIADTIEKRGIGEVVEQTSSIDTLELVVEYEQDKKIRKNLEGLLQSLGFSDFKLHDVLSE